MASETSTVTPIIAQTSTFTTDKIQRFEELTINFWINFDSLEDTHILSNRNTFTVEYKADASGLEFTIEDSNSNSYSLRSGTALTTGTWYMVSMVYTGSSFVCYVDGAEKSSQATDNNLLKKPKRGIKLGEFNGLAQELRIYDYALSAEDIQALYDVVNSPGTITSSEKTL